MCFRVGEDDRLCRRLPSLSRCIHSYSSLRPVLPHNRHLPQVSAEKARCSRNALPLTVLFVLHADTGIAALAIALGSAALSWALHHLEGYLCDTLAGFLVVLTFAPLFDCGLLLPIIWTNYIYAASFNTA